MNPAWLITCKSGRQFIVYAKTRDWAGEKFERMMPDECKDAYVLRPYVVAPTLADA